MEGILLLGPHLHTIFPSIPYAGHCLYGTMISPHYDLQQKVPTVCGVDLYCTTGWDTFSAQGISWHVLCESLFFKFLLNCCNWRDPLSFLVMFTLSWISTLVPTPGGHWLQPCFSEPPPCCLRGQCTPLISINIKEYIDNTIKMTHKINKECFVRQQRILNIWFFLLSIRCNLSNNRLHSTPLERWKTTATIQSQKTTRTPMIRPSR